MARQACLIAALRNGAPSDRPTSIIPTCSARSSTRWRVHARAIGMLAPASGRPMRRHAQRSRRRAAGGTAGRPVDRGDSAALALLEQSEGGLKAALGVAGFEAVARAAGEFDFEAALAALGRALEDVARAQRRRGISG
jgi:hypothetical protein